MRTQEELVKRYEERKGEDQLGFETDEYFVRLDWEHAKPYLKNEATPDDWGSPVGLERESLLERMKGYMPFAHEKADNERGISAWRSVAHYQAWIWLLGDEEFLAVITREYDGSQDYGKSTLAMICDQYGFQAVSD